MVGGGREGLEGQGGWDGGKEEGEGRREGGREGGRDGGEGGWGGTEGGREGRSIVHECECVHESPILILKWHPVIFIAVTLEVLSQS